MRRWAHPRGEECEAINFDPGSAPYIRPMKGVLAGTAVCKALASGVVWPDFLRPQRDTASAAMVC